MQVPIKEGAKKESYDLDLSTRKIVVRQNNGFPFARVSKSGMKIICTCGTEIEMDVGGWEQIVCDECGIVHRGYGTIPQGDTKRVVPTPSFMKEKRKKAKKETK